MLFQDREEAGRSLAIKINSLRTQPLMKPSKNKFPPDTIVLGLARGGVPVAKEISRYLQIPMDCMIIRKIGHPKNEEFAIGSIGPYGMHQWDSLASYVSFDYLSNAVEAAQMELNRRESLYRHGRPPLGDIVRGMHVILADDGIATGTSMMLAIAICRHIGAASITVSAPITSPEVAHRLRTMADQVITLYEPVDFMAVGTFYANFPQLTDAEVVKYMS